MSMLNELIEEAIKSEVEKELLKKQYIYKPQVKVLNEFMDDLLETVIDEDFLKRNNRKNFKLFIAGGAVTSVFAKQDINDYDIYFYSEEDFEDFNCEVSKHATDLTTTDRAISYNRSGTNFQLIKLFGTPEEIFNKFDFTVCMGALVYGCRVNDDGAFSWDKEHFVFDDRFFIDNVARSLIFNKNTEYPINSLFRVKKYKDKGYKINTLEMMKIALRISLMDIKTVKDVKNQVFGLSSEVMNELSLELKELDDNVSIEDPIKFIEDVYNKIPVAKSYTPSSVKLDFNL